SAGIELLRHTPGQIGQTPRLNGVLHRLGHQYRLLRVCDGAVHQHRLTAQFHGDGRVGSGTYTGINQHRHLGLFEDDAQVVRVADAKTSADQAGQRHDGDTADLGQLAGDDRVVAGVDHDVETFANQDFSRLEGLDHVGKQGLLICQHFQLD